MVGLIFFLCVCTCVRTFVSRQCSVISSKVFHWERKERGWIWTCRI